MANAFCMTCLRGPRGTAGGAVRIAPGPRYGMAHATGGGRLTEWIVWPYRGRMQSFDRQSRDACQEPDGPGQRTARISRAMRCRSAMSNGLVSTGTFTSSMKP